MVNPTLVLSPSPVNFAAFVAAAVTDELKRLEVLVAAALDTMLIERVELAETKEVEKGASLVAAMLASELEATMVEEPIDGTAEGTLLITGATGPRGATMRVSAGGTMAVTAGEMMGAATGTAAAGTEKVAGKATAGPAGGAKVAMGATVVGLLDLVFAGEGTSGAILRGVAGIEVVGTGAGAVEVVVTRVTIVLLSVMPGPGA
ncbi:MAG: hypothetical protein LQ347_003443 [Umbilicaria vellea]|nr:MAG: hypothetical protein LQ347_003443 [Umbilicaria vellea]